MKLFEQRPSEKSSTFQQGVDSKTKVENSQKNEGEAAAVDLTKAIKRMKDDDFFEKEYAKDLKKR